MLRHSSPKSRKMQKEILRTLARYQIQKDHQGRWKIRMFRVYKYDFDFLFAVTNMLL
jgi:hypothetical protein